MKNKNHTIVLTIVLVASFAFCIDNEPTPSGFDYGGVIDASNNPVQSPSVSAEPIKIIRGDEVYTLTPKTAYTASVMVARKEYYYLGWESDVAPFDMVFAWGRLAEPDTDEHITYSQSGRWYNFKYDSGSPVGRSYIQSHSSNNHIIPANENVYAALKTIEDKQKIILHGYLVDVDGTSSWRRVWWKTSLSRTDDSAGACEIFYVTKVRIEDKIYE